MTKNSFCDFQTAKLLKGLGFNELCITFYEEDGTFKFNNGDEYDDNKINIRANWSAKNKVFNEGYYTAPTWGQIKDWMWLHHRVFVTLTKWVGGFEWQINTEDEIIGLNSTNCFGSPTIAEIQGIKIAVQYLKNYGTKK